jgi:hypothetical protein
MWSRRQNSPGHERAFAREDQKIVDIFHDMILEIDEMIFEGDTMCFRYYMRQLGGPDDVTGICIVKFEGDKLIHRWVYSNAPR